MRRYLIGGRSVGERERVKTITKKGYFESAEELLSLINNLSLLLLRKIKRHILVEINETVGDLKVKG